MMLGVTFPGWALPSTGCISLAAEGPRLEGGLPQGRDFMGSRRHQETKLMYLNPDTLTPMQC